MITNDLEYSVTKEQANKFAATLSRLEASVDSANVDPLLVELQRAALQSQYEDLLSQLEEYEAIRSGKRKVEIKSVDEFPHALIQARIALGISVNDLAQKVDIPKEQLERHERTDYASAPMSLMKKVAKNLQLDVPEVIERVPDDAKIESLYHKAIAIGLNREFVQKRLMPKVISAAPEGPGLQGAIALSRVFGWSVPSIYTPEPLPVDPLARKAACFKLSPRVCDGHLEVYSVYAHYLAIVVLKATKYLNEQEIPTDARAVRKEILGKFGSLEFQSVLSYIWDLGIPVLPLRDPGAFHGALWREKERNVIVLKQRTRSSARWSFDLLHELWHAAQNPCETNDAVVELPDMEPERLSSQEEQQASIFAGDVLLDGRSEELTQLCVQAAHKSVELLKGVVPRVASTHNVPVGALANYLAFRLSLQGINWWGAATNLQPEDNDPWVVARDQLVKNLNFEYLDEVDRNLLEQAISEDWSD